MLRDRAAAPGPGQHTFAHPRRGAELRRQSAARAESRPARLRLHGAHGVAAALEGGDRRTARRERTPAVAGDRRARVLPGAVRRDAAAAARLALRSALLPRGSGSRRAAGADRRRAAQPQHLRPAFLRHAAPAHPRAHGPDRPAPRRPRRVSVARGRRSDHEADSDSAGTHRRDSPRNLRRGLLGGRARHPRMPPPYLFLPASLERHKNIPRAARMPRARRGPAPPGLDRRRLGDRPGAARPI